MIKTTTLPESLLVKLRKQFDEINLFLKKSGQENYSFEDYEVIFSKYGWFIPFNFSLRELFKVVNLFENGEGATADKILSKFFKKEFKSINKGLIKKYPERTEIFNEAFKCHKQKLFYSSTILFLSQADGLTKGEIFRGKILNKLIKKKEKHPVVNILHKENPLSSRYNPRTKNSNFFSNLNRHGVMHGLSTDFGNELNSYKSLSLLCFVSDFRIR